MTGLMPIACSVLVLCLVFTFIVGSSIRTVETANEQNILYLVSNRLDSIASESETICNDIETSTWFYDSFISSSLSTYRLTASMKRETVAGLSMLTAAHPGVARISYMYYMAPSVLFSNIGVFENIDFFRAQYPDKLDYCFVADHPDGFSRYSFSGKNYLLYSKDVAVTQNGSKKARINIFLDETKVLDSLNTVAGHQVAAFRIVSEDGKQLWTADGIADSSENCVTLEKTSEILPVKYCLDVPVSIARKSTRDAMPILIAILIFDIILCVLVAVYYAFRNYAPLKETISRYAENGKAGDNELEMLNRIIDKAFNDREDALNSLDMIQPLARQRIMRGIIDGTGMISDNKDAFSACGLVFDRPLYNVIAIKTSISKLIRGKTEDDMEMQLTAVAMDEFISESTKGLALTAYLYVHDSSRFSIVTNYGTKEDFRIFINRLYKKCTLAVAEGGESAETVIGIGNQTDTPRLLHRASDQADFALSYHVGNKGSGISCFDDVFKQAEVLVQYSRSEERMLEQSIAAGNAGTAIEIVSEVIEENAAIVSPQSYRILYDSVLMTVVRSAQENGVNVSVLDSNFTFRNLGDVRTKLIEIVNEVCGEIRRKASAKAVTDDISVLEYVNEHLYDSSLSVQLIAEKFGRPQASISEGFKKLTGSKYIDYVNEKRIAKAIDLIEKEGLDFNQVYARVGYVSISTFRRNYGRFAPKTERSH